MYTQYTDQLLTLLFVGVLVFSLLYRLLPVRGESPQRQLVRTLFFDGLRDTLPDLQGPVEEGESHVRFSSAGRQGRITLEQLYRRCEEQPGDMGWIVRRAVLAVRHALEDSDSLPAEWRDCVYPLLLPQDAVRPEDLVTRPFVDGLLIAYALDAPDAFRLLRRGDLAAGMKREGDAPAEPISEEELATVAMRNLDRSGAGIGIDTLNEESDEHDTLLRFHSGDGLDAARVLMPAFFTRYSPRFGDTDLLVAIPTRDVMVVLADRDPSQATFLAMRVRSEQRKRAYPLHSRLLRACADGVLPWKAGV